MHTQLFEIIRLYSLELLWNNLCLRIHEHIQAPRNTPPDKCCFSHTSCLRLSYWNYCVCLAISQLTTCIYRLYNMISKRNRLWMVSVMILIYQLKSRWSSDTKASIVSEAPCIDFTGVSQCHTKVITAGNLNNGTFFVIIICYYC